MSDPSKKAKFLEYLDSSKMPMAGYIEADGKYVKGIEDYIPKIHKGTSEQGGGGYPRELGYSEPVFQVPCYLRNK